MWIYKWEISITGASLGGGRSLANVYLWENLVWTAWYKPWTNTVIYLPMKTDLLDHWPNSIAITNTNSVSISNWAWYFWWASRRLSFTNPTNMSGSWTISTWFKTSSNAQQWIFTQWTWAINKCLHCGYSETSRWLVLAFYSNDMDSWSTSWTDWNWHHVAFTYNGWWSTIIYLDWAVLKSWSLSSLATWNNTGVIWDYAASTGNTFNGYMSEFIIESVVRTASDIQKYYNQTKSNYWL